MMRLLLPAALAYVAPTIIGWQRRVAGAGALAILNVLLGWTGVGWIVCMLWAVWAHQAGRFTGQQIAEDEEFKRWKAEKSGFDRTAGYWRPRCRSAAPPSLP